MSEERDPGGGDGGSATGQQQSAGRTGAGAGTAMEAMLRKRQMQTREPDAAPGATRPADAGSAPPDR